MVEISVDGCKMVVMGLIFLKYTLDKESDLSVL